MTFSVRSFAIYLIAAFAPVTAVRAENWESTLTAATPGTHPAPRALRATYRFGWNGITAARASVRVTNTGGERVRVEGKGRTTGLARALWKFDVQHSALSDLRTLRPIEAKQIEQVRSKKMTTELAFSPGGVISKVREEGRKSKGAKVRRFDLPNLFDLNSALLFLRSQPLRDGAVYRLAVYPATSAYLATVSVQGRERISLPGGTYNAIKLDLKLSKIGKKRQLEPHKKFRRATAWISDDADRMMLRSEAQVFVGVVFAEIESVQYDGAQPTTPLP